MENENQPSESNVTATANAIAALAKEIPVYPDAIQPAAKEFGKGLQTIAKAVNIGLAPVKLLVWGYERIEQYLEKTVSEKLNNIPQENIISPPIEVAGPAIEAMRFTENQPDLREMYANLLATAMNSATVLNAHPSFVEILKNISGDECLILQEFIQNKGMPSLYVRRKNFDNNNKETGYSTIYSLFTPLDIRDIGIKAKSLIPSYMENLSRLGLLTLSDDQYFTDITRYDTLLNSEFAENYRKVFTDRNILRELDFVKGTIEITPFGEVFIATVVAPK